MKRKSSRRSAKAEEEDNGLEEAQENGDNEEPSVKKGRKSKVKGGKKSKHETESEESEDEIVRKSQKRKGVKDEDEAQENGGSNEGSSKKGRKGKGKKSKHDQHSEDEADPPQSTKETDPLDPLAGDDDDDEAQYEVEAILDEKMVKGVRHFLIRWKGYTEESDTWEPEDTLECADLIKDFKENAKKNKKKDGKKKSGKVKKDEDEASEKWDENEDFEVDRIVDVYFHKSGKRDFLVSWKGFPAAENTWEPEDNMDCKDLIQKFMLKVEAARNVDAVETKLRVVRKQVNRLAYSMHEHDRRLSRRHRGKERVRYFDAE